MRVDVASAAPVHLRDADVQRFVDAFRPVAAARRAQLQQVGVEALDVGGEVEGLGDVVVADVAIGDEAHADLGVGAAIDQRGGDRPDLALGALDQRAHRAGGVEDEHDLDHGFVDHAGFAGRIDSISVKARNATGAKCLSIDIPSERRPRAGCSARVRVRAAPELRRAIGGFAENFVCVASATPRALHCKPRYECGHESRGKTYAQHLARGRRRDRRRHRPDAVAAPLRHNPARNITGRGARDRHDAGARRAADRGDRGLRHLPGAARRCLRRIAGARLCSAAGDASDRDQSEMGARRDGGGGAQPPARGARRRRLSARRRDLRRGRRDQPGDRPPRPAS